jgi:hypothetical protein
MCSHAWEPDPLTTAGDDAAACRYDIHKALASELVVKHSLHKTLANQMKEKLLDYVRIESGAKFFLLTDQRVMIIDPDDSEGGGPLSIPLHRTQSPATAIASVLPISTRAIACCLSARDTASPGFQLTNTRSIDRFAEVSSSSKGPSGTTLDILYEDANKKTKKLPVVSKRKHQQRL